MTPEELYRARLAPHLQEAQATLNANIESIQSENVVLSQRIQSQRSEIEDLLSSRESLAADLEGAATAATQFSMENDLRKEALQMEEEVKTRSDI